MLNLRSPFSRKLALPAIILALGAGTALTGCGSGSTGSSSLPPTAQPFTLTMLRPSAYFAVPNGSPLTFGALCSGGTPPYTYSWNFGDGSSTQNSSSGASLVTHGYTTTGSYSVSASCVDAGGAKAPSPGIVPIRSAIPAPTIRGFSSSTATAQVASPVDFTLACLSPYATSLSYLWNFGDGSPIQPTTTATAQHTYNASGSYVVTASCIDTANSVTSRASLTLAVAVPKPTVVAGLATDGAVAVDWSATFGVGCSGVGAGAWNYVWNFGDGSAALTTSVPTATHVYALDTAKTYPAIYPATVSCDNGSGTPATATADIAVSGSAPSLTLRAGQIGGAGYVDDVLASARFDQPFGVSVDAAGNVFVADKGNNVIRIISKNRGTVATLAGSVAGPGYLDGTGSSAGFTAPAGIAMDASGRLFIADGTDTVRMIVPTAPQFGPDGKTAGVVGDPGTVGKVMTLAGTVLSSGYANGTGTAAQFMGPQGIAVDLAGNLYVTDYQVVRKVELVAPQFGPDGKKAGVVGDPGTVGKVTTLAGGAGVTGVTDGAANVARFNGPAGVAVDAAGKLYVADSLNNTIRVVDAATGSVSTLAGKAGYSGSADGTGASARFNHPTLLSLDAGGNLYVADSGNHTVRKIAPGGIVTTLAGTAGSPSLVDGSGSAARFNSPAGVAVDAAGNVYVADTLNSAIRVTTAAGLVSTIAGSQAHPGSTDANAEKASFWQPRAVAVDAAGDLFVADGNHTIRKITPARDVSTIAGKFGVSGAMDGAGTTQALFNGPGGIAVDAAGNLYVADTLNGTVRKVAATTGAVTTLAGTALNFGAIDDKGSAARFSSPTGVAVDAAGNVYVTDAGANRTIRMIDIAGNVKTIAGTAGIMGSADGIGKAASFNNPLGITLDASGTLYVSDRSSSGSASLRKITLSGGVATVTTVTTQLGNEGNQAALPDAIGVAVDAAGTVYVAQHGANAIRKVTPAGVVSTVVGAAGRRGFVTGVVPGVLNRPSGVAILGSTLYIVNTNENSIAEVGGIP